MTTSSEDLENATEAMLAEAKRARRQAATHRARTALGVSATITLVWLVSVTTFGLWPRVLASWPASLTMVFGSIVAGSTPQGGGAVAYPVFTKLLEVPSEVARTFSLCIQTVGMGAASLSIAINRRPVEWHTVAIATPAAAVGFLVVWWFGSNADLPFAPALVPSPYVKVTFTMVLLAMAYVVWAGSRVSLREVHRTLPAWKPRPIGVLVVLGALGGVTSGLVGSGADVFAYVAMVVFLALDPKVGINTSVLIMAAISLLGFLTFGLADGALLTELVDGDPSHVASVAGMAVHDVDGVARFGTGDGAGLSARRFDLFGLWLAAAPIVCWGAPFGAWLAAWMSARNLVRFVATLALAEVLSTAIFLEELRTDRWLLGYAVLGSLGFLLALNWIARHRAWLFVLPDVDFRRSVHPDRVDVAPDFRRSIIRRMGGDP